MNARDRVELGALAILAIIVVIPLVAGYATLAAVPTSGRSCSLSFSGQFESLQLAPAGAWTFTTSECSVTSQSGGITSGTFTGTLASSAASGVVTGTWSAAGSTYKVTASSTEFMLSFTFDHDVDAIPVLGASYQGILSVSTGMLLAVGIAGQIAVK